MMDTIIENIVKFTPVYDDVTARSLAREFTRLEGKMLEGEDFFKTIFMIRSYFIKLS